MNMFKAYKYVHGAAEAGEAGLVAVLVVHDPLISAGCGDSNAEAEAEAAELEEKT